MSGARRVVDPLTALEPVGSTSVTGGAARWKAPLAVLLLTLAAVAGGAASFDGGEAVDSDLACPCLAMIRLAIRAVAGGRCCDHGRDAEPTAREVRDPIAVSCAEHQQHAAWMQSTKP